MNDCPEKSFVGCVLRTINPIEWRARTPALPDFLCFVGGPKAHAQLFIETSAKSHFVILSEAKDLVFSHTYEILRSLRSLRMTGAGTFAEVSIYQKGTKEIAMAFSAVRLTD